MTKIIMNYNQSSLFDPEGTLIWQGEYNDRLSAIEKHKDLLGDSYGTLVGLCGAETRPNGDAWIRDSEIRKAAIDLKYISSDGCPAGFTVSLPALTHLNNTLKAFNREYFQARQVYEIDFPSVFDNRPNDMNDLTSKYEEQAQMFELGDRDEGLRLAYAADPGLFSWLRGKKLSVDKLPYSILSNAMAMRRHASGKLGPIQNGRQYGMSDMHTLATSETAGQEVLDLAKLNSESLKFWVGGEYAQFLDVTEEFSSNHHDLIRSMAQAAGTFTLVNQFSEKPRYYEMRSGMVADAGSGAHMLYNIQWDQENTERFRISTDDGSQPVIIHANALAGPKFLSTILGRSLAGLSPKAIPVELSPAPIALIPLREEFMDVANDHANRLSQKGILTRVEPPKKKFQKTVWKLRNQWQSAFAVIGEKEVGSTNLTFSQGKEAIQIEEDALFAAYAERIKRCQVSKDAPRIALPF